MKQILAIFIIIVLISLSFGCTENDDDNEEPEAFLKLEPSVAWIYDNSTGWTYPEITLNGNASRDPDGEITFFIFDMGEGNSTETPDNTTTHEYHTIGVLAASLEVEDNKGDKDKTSKDLTINYEMNHQSGMISEGSSETEEFPVSDYSPNNATLTITLQNRELVGDSEARVSIRNSQRQEVTFQEVTVSGDTPVELTVSKADFNSDGPGTWSVLVECTAGSISYDDCHLQVYYKS